MTASDYEVTEDDAELWAERVQDEESKESFENSATSDNGEKWAEEASDSADAYAAGVADYINASESDIEVEDDYADGCEDNGGAWTSGVNGSAERWADGVEDAQDEYEDGTSGAGQKWFSNYKDGVQGE